MDLFRSANSGKILKKKCPLCILNFEIVKLDFCFVLQIGSFFMLNLCLVVISSHFAETKERELTKMKLERKNHCSASVADTELLSKSIYSEIIEYVGHLYRLSRQQLVKFYQAKKVAFYKSKCHSTTIEENQQSVSVNPLCSKHGDQKRVPQDLSEDGKVVLRFGDKQTANYTTDTGAASISQQREQSSSPGKLLISDIWFECFY